jgi:hypothetical protein
VGAVVWVLRKENHMTSGTGPDEATKRAAYYRERAAEARVKAQAAKGIEARRTMLQVAGLWDYMAETAEPRSKGSVARVAGVALSIWARR